MLSFRIPLPSSGQQSIVNVELNILLKRKKYNSINYFIKNVSNTQFSYKRISEFLTLSQNRQNLNVTNSPTM